VPTKRCPLFYFFYRCRFFYEFFPSLAPLCIWPIRVLYTHSCVYARCSIINVFILSFFRVAKKKRNVIIIIINMYIRRQGNWAFRRTDKKRFTKKIKVGLNPPFIFIVRLIYKRALFFVSFFVIIYLSLLLFLKETTSLNFYQVHWYKQSEI